MAIAMIPPHEREKMVRREAERAAMNSIDPVERWNAKERAFNRGMAEFGAAMVQQAKANAKAAERQEREAQEAERRYHQSKYRSL